MEENLFDGLITFTEEKNREIRSPVGTIKAPVIHLSRKMRKNTIQHLKDDYHALYTSFSQLHHLYTTSQIKDYEFIASYILIYWKSRYSTWILGKFVENVENAKLFDISSGLSVDDLPNFNLSNYERNRLHSLLNLNSKNNQKISVIAIFHYCLLTGLPVFVNNCITQWANGKRKIRLLFDIPSSDEVFYMQSIGERCITAFIQEHELSRTLKETYRPFEERDALSFLLHDIQHLEKFADPLYYYEQIGFCNMLRNFIKSREWDQYKEYDNEFIEDLEHVSDMNACSVHLFSFFKSKLFLAEQRFISRTLLEDKVDINNDLITEEGHLSDYQKIVILSPIFEAWKLPQDVRQSIEVISLSKTLRSMDRHHTELIRQYFDQIGQTVYNSLYPT